MDVGVDKVTPSPGRDKGHTASQGAFGSYPKLWEHKCPPANGKAQAVVVTAPGCAPCVKLSLRTEQN